MRWTFIVGLLMLTVTVVFSQNPQGIYRVEIIRSSVEDDIQGFVYEQAGLPVARATVVLKNMGSGVEYTVNAGEDGSYKFRRLTTADSYELSVTLPEFEKFDVKGVNIGWKLATRLDIVLRPK